MRASWAVSVVAGERQRLRPADIYEDDQKLTFKVEVPGIDEKEVKVEIENNMLTVRGERKLEKDIKEGNFCVCTIERINGALPLPL